MGEEDSFLNRNPEITLFKGQYKRYTHYSVQPQYIEPLSVTDRVYEFEIPKLGDMLYKTFLTFKIGYIDYVANGSIYKKLIGHRIIKRCWVAIDNVVYQRFDGDWLQIQSELYLTEHQHRLQNLMTGHVDQYEQPADGYNERLIYVPLKFWFSKDLAQSLPLCAMKYSKIQIFVECAPFEELTSDGTGFFVQEPRLMVDYVYLNEDERKKFLEQEMEYVIEQVQTEEFEVNGTFFRLYLGMKRLVKELYWVYKENDIQTVFTDMQDQQSATLYLEGHKRFQERNQTYFNTIQPYQYHTRAPTVKNIFSYSFSLFPEMFQPSGSCNFTVIANKLLEIYLSNNFNGTIKIYGLNYNVVSISGGKASLLFSY